MNLTPEQYAELVIAKAYKVETTYNLARAIARVADKYAKWVMEASNRQTWATDGTETHANYLALSQHEAYVKREAYRLALIALTDKLPK
jgi:arabinogalactan endo-1,4-beta-galactosidase